MERGGQRGFFARAGGQAPRPLVPDDGGPFDFHRANVQAERRDPESLLNQLERLIRVRKECPQIGAGHFRLVDTDQPDAVFAHACTDGDWAILILHNLSADQRPGVRVRLWDDEYGCAIYLFEHRENQSITGRELIVDLTGHGFCWLRLRRR